MSNAPFNENYFQDFLDRQGADPDRWPPAAHEQATALLRSSARARALFAEAQRLEEVLGDAFPSLPAPPGLAARILATVSEAPQAGTWTERLATWMAGAIWRPVGLASLPLLLGFALGMSFTPDTADLEAQVLIALSDTGFANLELGDEP